MQHGLILFAHGAREPLWVEPFETLAKRVKARAPNTPVRLAFLELMSPDLESAAAELIAEGVDSVRIVPVFFGQGGHLRRDLPELVGSLRARYPEVAFNCAQPVGEDDAVLDAIVAYCLRP